MRSEESQGEVASQKPGAKRGKPGGKPAEEGRQEGNGRGKKRLWYRHTVESYSATKENAFESVLMGWMKLEPII